MRYRFSWKRAVALEFRNPVHPRPRKISYDATTVFQELMDCLDCGECCHAREGTLLIVDEDIEMWRCSGDLEIVDSLVPGHFGQLAFPMTEKDQCIYHGTEDNPHACIIYEKRAAVCRSFAMLCPQCLDIRRNRNRPL